MARACMGRFALAGGLLATLATGGCEAPAPLTPNLVLVTSDALSTSSLSCYDTGGEAGEAGAVLCGLAAAGGRSSWRPPAPTSRAAAMASILTSLEPADHGLLGSSADFLSSTRLSLAEVLRHTGYATGAVVANPALGRSRNFHQGFDRFYDRDRGNGSERRTGLAPGATTDAALAWARSTRAPWFLWIHYQASPRVLDTEVGRLLGALDELGVDPGVLLSASGPETGDPGSGTSPSDDVPVLWRAPDKRPLPDERLRPASPLDLGPTLLRAARQPGPREFQGRALFASRPLALPSEPSP